MKSAVYHSPGDIRIEERQKPEERDNNMVAKVKCCALCGSDLKMWLVGDPKMKPPRIIGHEMVGVLTHVGKDVKGYKPGERITLATTIGCGECFFCRSNRSNICPDAMSISNSSDGAFAEYIEIPPLAISGGNAVKVPDNIPDEFAVLSEPLGCAINGQQLAGIKAGDRVLIIGGGAMGALNAELAKAMGAFEVIVAETSVKRMALLRRLKGVHLINSLKEDVGDVVMERTEGLGVDAVIVCAPVKDVYEKSVGYVRKGGSVCFSAGIPEDQSEITVESRLIHYGEVMITGVFDSRPEHVAQALKLMSEGRIHVESIITHKLPIEKFEKGLELMKAAESLKVLIYPEEAC